MAPPVGPQQIYCWKKSKLGLKNAEVHAKYKTIRKKSKIITKNTCIQKLKQYISKSLKSASLADFFAYNFSCMHFFQYVSRYEISIKFYVCLYPFLIFSLKMFWGLIGTFWIFGAKWAPYGVKH